MNMRVSSANHAPSLEKTLDELIVMNNVCGRLFGDSDMVQIDKYMVIDVLGHGGMGSVYRAIDLRRDCCVAVKVLRVSVSCEIDRLSPIAHPSVVKVLDSGIWQGHQFVVMEYIDGHTLDRWSPTGSVDAVLDVLYQVADGLCSMHQVGIVHGDIKPRNVVVSKCGRARIIDLEFSSVCRGRTQTMSLMGTPGFMAPEQKRGMPPNELSDQFSFCVMAQKVIEDSLVEREEIPPRILRALARGAEVSPKQRHKSMKRLVHELRTGYPPAESSS